MRSDVIGDFQEPYGAVLVEGDGMGAFLPSGQLRKRRGWRLARPAVASIRRGGGWRTLPEMVEFVDRISQRVKSQRAGCAVSDGFIAPPTRIGPSLRLRRQTDVRWGTPSGLRPEP